ncbi:hypothetical protein [Rheinheimera sp.]|uniref:hypothetical protein n=1 Tax=Rheinheimera sp. TaxID=1869214 RepID=UPI00307EC4DB
MAGPLIKPGIGFSAQDKGGDYLPKLQQLAAAVDAAFDAFNLQLEAAQTAEQIRVATAQIKSQVEAIQGEINHALAAAYNAIGTAGDTATYARQLQTARKIGNKLFNGTADVELELSDVTGLTQRLDDIELMALAGL